MVCVRNFRTCVRWAILHCIRRLTKVHIVYGIEAQWLDGRIPDSRSRERGHESPTCDGAVDGDTLWRRQKILVLLLGNKL